MDDVFRAKLLEGDGMTETVDEKRLAELERLFTEPWVRDLCAALREALVRAEQAERMRDEALAWGDALFCSLRDIWPTSILHADGDIMQNGHLLPHIAKRPQALAELRARIEAKVWKEAAHLVLNAPCDAREVEIIRCLHMDLMAKALPPGAPIPMPWKSNEVRAILEEKP